MFKSMRINWAIWIRAATAAAAVLAIFVSAIAMSPEIDHRILSTQTAFDSAPDISAFDDGLAQLVPGATCHIGHSCIPAITLNNELALASFDSAPERPHIKDYRQLAVGDLLFHPPRFFSQV